MITSTVVGVDAAATQTRAADPDVWENGPERQSSAEIERVRRLAFQRFNVQRSMITNPDLAASASGSGSYGPALYSTNTPPAAMSSSSYDLSGYSVSTQCPRPSPDWFNQYNQYGSSES
jgi:hypothetical protein